ncbi:hypothetical protein CR513_30866, partial [Mucuna pruriens]
MTSYKEWFTSHKLGNFSCVYLGGDNALCYCWSGIKQNPNVRHTLDSRKNLIFFDILQANGFSYKTNRDKDTLKITSIESNDDTTKL